MHRAGSLVCVAALALVLAGCSGGSDTTSGDTSDPVIPPRTTAPSLPLPVVTLAGGAPEITQFSAPTTFSCLAGKPAQAQVTIGWNVPSATDVEITLDGAAPPSGVQDAMPFQVPAGPAWGPGVTMVFPCEPAATHEITMTWRVDDSPPTERSVSIVKTEEP